MVAEAVLEKKANVVAVDIYDIDIDSGYELSLNSPANLFFDTVNVAGSLKAELSFTRNDEDIYVLGKASVRLKAECGRCLNQFELPVEVDIQTAFFPEEKVGEDEDSYTYKGDSIDVLPMLCEQLLLQMPLRTVCGEECKGLCPSCGKNLNKGGCGCSTDAVDGRFAVLKKLKEKQ